MLTTALDQPLLGGTPAAQASGAAAKLSNCDLHRSCFLNDGVGIKSQDRAQKKVQTKLLVAVILATLFMIVEVIGGYLAQSVAIMSDAAHMLSDVAGFGMSLMASYAVTWRSHHNYSFGYHRAEIIGALFSTLVIWAVTGALLWEATMRVINPQPVDGKIMFIVASAGVVFNIILSLVLGEEHTHGLSGPCSGHDHDHSDHDHHGHDSPHGKACSGHSHSHSQGLAAAPSLQSSPVHSYNVADIGSQVHSEAASRHVSIDVQRSAAGAAGGASGNHAHAAQPSGAVPPLPSSAKATCSEDHEHEHHENDSPHEHGAGSRARSHSHSHKGHSHSHDNHSHDHGNSHGHSHGHGHGHGHGHNLNMRSAVLHVLGDLLQSIGVAIAGALIWWHQDDQRWVIADPICTFIFAILVLLTTKGIIQDIIHTLMERTPTQHDIVQILEAMHTIPGVQDVHDLHIWNLSMGIPIMTAHVHVSQDASTEQVLQAMESFARSRGIQHSTVQICNPRSQSDLLSIQVVQTETTTATGSANTGLVPYVP